MIIKVGQRVRVFSPDGTSWSDTGEVVGENLSGYFYVRKDSGGISSYHPKREMLPINEASPEEGWIGGTDAEDDDVQERSV